MVLVVTIVELEAVLLLPTVDLEELAQSVTEVVAQLAVDGIVVVVYKGPQRGTGGTIDTTSRPGYTIHKFTSSGNDTYIA